MGSSSSLLSLLSRLMPPRPAVYLGSGDRTRILGIVPPLRSASPTEPSPQPQEVASGLSSEDLVDLRQGISLSMDTRARCPEKGREEASTVVLRGWTADSVTRQDGRLGVTWLAGRAVRTTVKEWGEWGSDKEPVLNT